MWSKGKLRKGIRDDCTFLKYIGSRRKVAEVVKVSPRTITKWIEGKCKPSLTQLEMIINHFLPLKIEKSLTGFNDYIQHTYLGCSEYSLKASNNYFVEEFINNN